MNKNICISIEMMTIQFDSYGLVLKFSYTESLSTSYKTTKQLVKKVYRK